jgi:hypothetical protein
MSQRIFTEVEIKNLKREAKKLSKRDGIPHVEALNRIAIREGFPNWWYLQHKAQSMASSTPSSSTPSSSTPSSSTPSSSAETIVAEDVLPDLAYRLMDEDDRVLAAI